MGLKEFFKTMLLTLNPSSYEKLVERKLTNSVNYFFSLVFAMFAIMCIIFLPILIMLPGTMQEKLGSFNTLDIKITQAMNSPIKIPADSPQIIIDTSKNYTVLEEGKILITNGAILYKILPFTKPQMVVREGQLLSNKQQISEFFMIILIMMLPMLLAIALLYSMIKYLLIVLIVAILGFLIARITRFGVTISEVFKTAFFASTVMVAAGLLTKPFVFNVYYSDILLFIVFFILGLSKVGDFESVVRPRRYKPSMFDRQQ